MQSRVWVNGTQVHQGFLSALDLTLLEHIPRMVSLLKVTVILVCDPSPYEARVTMTVPLKKQNWRTVKLVTPRADSAGRLQPTAMDQQHCHLLLPPKRVVPTLFNSVLFLKSTLTGTTHTAFSPKTLFFCTAASVFWSMRNLSKGFKGEMTTYHGSSEGKLSCQDNPNEDCIFPDNQYVIWQADVYLWQEWNRIEN